MSPQRHDRGALLFSALVVSILYWPAVSGQGAFFERDVWLYWIPHIEWAARTLAAGHLPQWNPFVGFGAPFMADPSFQFFYPPTLLTWVLQPKTAYTVLVVGHSIFGGVGAIRLLRRLRSRNAAFLGAVVFVSAGPIVSSANLWHHLTSAMYLPWVLDAFLRLRSGRGSVARLGLLTGLQALAGSADVCLMAGVSMVYLLPRRARRLSRLSLKLAASLVICCLLAAIQWIPTLMLARSTVRASSDPTGRLYWSVAPVTLIDLVLPVDGTAHAISGEPEFAEHRMRFITWMYMGASTLPLLLLGMRRSPRGALFLLIIVLCSLGRNTPLGQWAQMLPVLSTVRFPSKLLWLVSACWATLSAIGFKELSRRPEGVSKAGMVGGGLILLLAALTLGSSSPLDHEDWRRLQAGLPWAPFALGGLLLVASLGRRLKSGVFLIVAIDLIGSARNDNAYARSEMMQTRPTVVDQLRGLNVRRVFVDQNSRPRSLSWKTPAGWSEEEAYYFGQAQFLSPPQSTRWSIRGSFDGDFTGLGRPEYGAFCSLAAGGPAMNVGLLRLAGVTHAIRFQDFRASGLPETLSVPTFYDRPVSLMTVPDPLPPAYIAAHVRSEASMSNALRRLADAGFPLKDTVVRVGTEVVDQTRFDTGPSHSSVLSFEERSEGHSLAKTHLAEPGTLVVLNAFSEGWQATVDGRPAVVQPANLIFQSVDLPAGDHLVEFKYRTPGLLPGLTLSAVGWLFLAWRFTRPVARS